MSGGAITELLELSPLPFSIDGLDITEAALRACPSGVPTFYVAPSSEMKIPYSAD